MMKNLIFFGVIILFIGACQQAQEPVACFDVAPGNYLTRDEVEFTDCSDNAESYEWDFGDGVISSREASPTHAFERAGEHEVFLKVYNEDGLDEISHVVSVGRYGLAQSTLVSHSVTGDCAVIVLEADFSSVESACNNGNVMISTGPANQDGVALGGLLSTAPELSVGIYGNGTKELLSTTTQVDLENQLIYPGVVFTNSSNFNAVIDIEFAVIYE